MLTSLHGEERSVDVELAIAAAERHLAKRNYSVHHVLLGKRINTVHLLAVNGSGISVNGAGKGVHRQSFASAIFEAIEHIYTVKFESNHHSNVKSLDLEKSDLFLAKGAPYFERLEGNSDLCFTRIEFSSLTEIKIVEYPAFLIYPHFKAFADVEISSINDHSLMRYSSNSGAAAGVNVDEATLHGMLEVIERDAIGIALLKTIFKKSPEPVKIVRLSSLPLNIAKLITVAEIQESAKFVVYDISCDTGLPVFMSFMLTDTGDKFFGSGASLNAEYALERAVLEAVQYRHISNHIGRPSPKRRTSSDITKIKFLSAFLESGLFEYRGGSILVDFPSVNKGGTSLKEKIATVANLCSAVGVEFYRRIVVNDEIAVVQITAPKLERFHLLARGVIVMPGSRGRKMLQ
ncbi:ribosomal protein S12 methylthiotransferase accessory factor [Paraburkholderia sp. GAS199]|uniref:YcaO-like family protein n=1 Tax=Paraburkholderia sp. GAS199 TaxID=3035126 RepID=UPI003D1B0E58